jgi:hypothetical protein
MKIYVWRCDFCEQKGATNEEPTSADLIHLPCGRPLKIEVFSDVFFHF